MVVYSLIALGDLKTLKELDDRLKAVLQDPKFIEICYKRVFLVTDEEAKGATV